MEVPLRARFANVGVEARKPFAADQITPEQKSALEIGMKIGLEKIRHEVGDAGEG